MMWNFLMIMRWMCVAFVCISTEENGFAVWLYIYAMQNEWIYHCVIIRKITKRQWD